MTWLVLVAAGVIVAVFITLYTDAVKEEREEEERSLYTVDINAWLQGKDLFYTNLFTKNDEVKRQAHKILIEETIEAYGAFSMRFGRDYEEDGEFFPLTVNDEKVVCRELWSSYPGDAETPPRRTFKLEKIELENFIPVVEEEIYTRNISTIREVIEKKGYLTTLDYTDDRGIYRESVLEEQIPLRLDDEYFYFKKPGKGQKEQRVRLKWIEEVDYDTEEDED